MMEKALTTVYFVRHAQPNYENHDDMLRELTAKGLEDRKLVTKFLADKNVDVVLCYGQTNRALLNPSQVLQNYPKSQELQSVVPQRLEIGLKSTIRLAMCVL